MMRGCCWAWPLQPLGILTVEDGRLITVLACGNPYLTGVPEIALSLCVAYELLSWKPEAVPGPGNEHSVDIFKGNGMGPL